MRSAFILLLVISGPVFSAQAQNSAGNPGLKQDSTGVIDVRSVSAEQLKAYKSDEAFDYTTGAVQPQYQWLIIKWFFRALDVLISNRVANFIMQLLFYVIFGAVLILLLNQLFKGQLSALFGRKSEETSMQVEVSTGEISESEIDRRLQEAMENRDYNKAIQLIYRKSLILLSNANLVNIRPEKTNHEYLAELRSPELSGPFEKMTLYYEFAEYGNFPVDSETFNRFKTMYQNFERQIASQES